MTKLGLEAKRYYFRTPYKIATSAAALLLVSSSVTTGMQVKLPMALFLGAVIGAFALASFVVPYLTIGEGKLRVFMFINNNEIHYDTIVKFTVEEGGSVRVNLKGGTSTNIRLYHIPASQRNELIEVLRSIAPLEDARKG